MKLVVLRGGETAEPLPGREGAARRDTRIAGAAALSGDARHWVLVNVSPLVADQLATDARLLRHPGLVDATPRVVVLTDAQMDHVTGLLSLRDGPPIHLYATPAVFEALTDALPVLPMLQHYCGVHWHVIPVAGECRTADFQVEGQPGLEFTALATDGPLPRHAETPAAALAGSTIALAVRDLQTGQRFFCANSLDDVGATAIAWMREADCLLLGHRSEPDDVQAQDTGEAWAALSAARAQRKLMLRSAPPDRESTRWLARWGLEHAADRMEIEL